MMKARLDRSDLELLLAIRQHGSLSGAASAADVVPSVVTKRLAALEARIGLQLFQRTTRKVVPTAEGEQLCDRAGRLLSGFADLETDLQERQKDPVGRIRLASTFGFGRSWLGPALAQFASRHPRIEVQLQLTERLPDLAVEGYDGAVWLWSVRGQRASEWTGRRLARNQRVLVAAPEYLQRRGTPLTVEELASHECLVVRESERFDVWRLQRERDRGEVRVRVAGRLSSNSGELVRDWCLAGHGIMLRSLWDIAGLLATGELVRVLPGHAMVDADIHWLAPHTPTTPRRIRLLVDFLADQFRTEPWTPKAAPVTARPGSRRRP
ncbi:MULTISPECIES: LysR substrate-binding domain-containing protein [Ramlibacter]|uniref:LysR family transcriptional regulator n=1 Tax=Ramlibacter pinisoli TaxID=2682844 RepID=A0A6N8INS1_9BURK|nr:MULTISPECIES: LysR substrate-binding domain-containing protein [Ramlibacter]MBA2963385.1 LysR family transcriptional regulator [Ramlibacter sp. CGMCC 1.13660]MVQ28352.1 LysR family transcriptional regulator [Ramlibacter pinisoli]